MKGISWFGFWIFMSVYICTEGYMYMNGHDTFFWQHRTEIEKQMQQKALENCNGKKTSILSNS